ncbi:phosphate ABC transporter ATP-binding protein PstB [Crocosphaera sp. XPORK-15E]|uniref:phosphate ABC transporter ATP-binding protein PstB n=1 Tax=Crocosphaera sp. XPORK-15E TaxID=3110247 RepID=UPI002B21A09C|nr:phosphate ABC transporter ATP-binding protein PstB [Crocosphaera sp. XPORK-15E]MEA5535552.1 phosphate ABC transporter ATP-binding protein PstB [Crocosphaera sp. XPORK-15E]
MENLEQEISQLTTEQTVFSLDHVDIYYGSYRAVRDVTFTIPKNQVTAFIGPSGCGKSTILRCLNRLNDLIDIFHLDGQIKYHGQNLYAPDIDPIEVRKRIGIVFQKPNPFPKTIYDNVAYGARVNKYEGNLDELVETSLRRAALWDEVKDKLKESGFSLSGGQQQRLCIARTIAAQPEVVLMDEPCSALDPISTLKVEELMHELKENYTIIIVTHNMQQATRVADRTAFFNAEATDKGSKVGFLVEYDNTEVIFGNPSQQDTKDYVSGRFG